MVEGESHKGGGYLCFEESGTREKVRSWSRRVEKEVKCLQLEKGATEGRTMFCGWMRDVIRGPQEKIQCLYLYHHQRGEGSCARTLAL